MTRCSHRAPTERPDGPAVVRHESLEARRLFVSMWAPDAPRPDQIAPIVTNYPIPTTGSVWYTSPAGTTGNSGQSVNSPTTLAAAVGRAPAGATIVVRGGTYRETGLTLTKKVMIQAYPGETPVLKGSQIVTAWTRDGTSDRWYMDTTPAGLGSGYAYEWPNTLTGEYFDPAYPLAGNREQVFRDNVPLDQVGTITAVAANTFFVDYAADRIYVGADPAGHTLEVTSTGRAMYAKQEGASTPGGSVVRGLTFTEYASQGLYFQVPDLVLENNTFTWCGSEGAVLGATYSNRDLVRNNVFTSNARKGLTLYGGQDNVIEGNTCNYNNVEGFATNWDAAGFKGLTMVDNVVRDNRFLNNYGVGCWLDISCVDNAVVRNTVRGNGRYGIFMEISRGGTIAFNLCTDNSVGIAVAGSSLMNVYNNTLYDNDTALRFSDGGRTNPNADEVAAGIDWVNKDNTVRNNLLGRSAARSTDYGLDAGSPRSGGSANAMIPAMDYNAYWRASSAKPAALVRWDPPTGSAVNYGTLSAFRGAQPSYEVHGLALDNVADPFFVNAAAGDFRLRPGSVALGKSTALPASVAAAAGVPVDVGYLGAFAAAETPKLLAAVSRKTHGTAGTFDLPLALTGPGTVEPRKGGAGTIVFTFDKPVRAADGVLGANEFGLTNATFASATVSGVTLTLSLAVINAKHTTVTLTGLTDADGIALGGDADLSVGNLYGDVDQSGTMTVLDLEAIKIVARLAVTATRFLADPDLSGSFSVLDLEEVKRNARSVLT